MHHTFENQCQEEEQCTFVSINVLVFPVYILLGLIWFLLFNIFSTLTMMMFIRDRRIEFLLLTAFFSSYIIYSAGIDYHFTLNDLDVHTTYFRHFQSRMQQQRKRECIWCMHTYTSQKIMEIFLIYGKAKKRRRKECKWKRRASPN